MEHSIDMETVIKGLEQFKADLKPFCGNSSDWTRVDDAIALLKEQEAVEARKEDDGTPQPCTSWWYVCGDCGQEIEYHDRYCRWCGRAVKWNG